MMNQWMTYNENDPRHHVLKIKKDLSDIMDHLHEGERKLDDPKARALFKKSGDLLAGLKKDFEDYEKK